jgi:hypothetical protein
MSASQIPPFLSTLKKGFQQFRDKINLASGPGQTPPSVT